MIATEVIAPGTLKIIAPKRLAADDFRDLSPQVDSMIDRHGKIRLLIDGTHLEGWQDISALEAHATFVKDHQAKAERIAVIAPHEWQHWLIGVARVFLHPEVKALDRGQEGEARNWLVG